MSDNQYTCPKCSAVLRPKNALNPGQKVKCPKCQNIFTPVAAAPPVDEEAETYGVRMETEEEKKKEEEVTKKSLGAVVDKRPKSSRGPAIATCTGPGNRMVATASITCVSCLFSIVVLFWPMFFSKAKLDDVLERWAWIGIAAAAFGYFGMIAYGAVMMLRLQSYAWAMVGAVLIVFPASYCLAYAAFIWLVKVVDKIAPDTGVAAIVFLSLWYIFTGAMVIQTLRKKEVVAGFKERKPGDI
jgi:uncharacterized Zn finger protein (UPF0148 family)